MRNFLLDVTSTRESSRILRAFKALPLPPETRETRETRALERDERRAIGFEGDMRERRSPLQFRPLEAELGITGVGNGKVEGSARWSAGRTVVTAEVKGPEASPSGLSHLGSTTQARSEDQISVSVKAVVRPMSGLPTEREHELEDKMVKFVQSVLDPSCPPRTTITVLVQVLSDDGSLLAAILNATSAALLEAGIPLYGSPASVSIAMTDNSAIYVDPDAREESTSQFVGTYTLQRTGPLAGSRQEGFDTRSTFVQVSTMGQASGQALCLAEKAAQSASSSLFEFINNIIN